MVLWLNHPRYTPLRDRLIEYLRSDRYRFRPISPVVFLCGGSGSSRRDTLRDYLRSHFPQLHLFYAEQVWKHISARSDRSALEMEADLAQLADLVIIVVESPGTFAELGAFALSDPLRKKLLPLIDKSYEASESFLATGPLRWINAESAFSPAVYVTFARILEAVGEIEKRIERIPKPKATPLSDLAASPKHLVFFLSDLIALIYPATLGMVEYYLQRIAPSLAERNVDLRTLIGLGLAMDLLDCHSVRVNGVEQEVLVPHARDPLSQPYHQRKHLDLPSQRAAHVSVLLAIPEARAVIEGLGTDK
jgi:hypothetical protein